MDTIRTIRFLNKLEEEKVDEAIFSPEFKQGAKNVAGKIGQGLGKIGGGLWNVAKNVGGTMVANSQAMRAEAQNRAAAAQGQPVVAPQPAAEPSAAPTAEATPATEAAPQAEATPANAAPTQATPAKPQKAAPSKIDQKTQPNAFEATNRIDSLLKNLGESNQLAYKTLGLSRLAEGGKQIKQTLVAALNQFKQEPSEKSLKVLSDAFAAFNKGTTEAITNISNCLKAAAKEVAAQQNTEEPPKPETQSEATPE
jgi:hypothetical protein